MAEDTVVDEVVVKNPEDMTVSELVARAQELGVLEGAGSGLKRDELLVLIAGATKKGSRAGGWW